MKYQSSKELVTKILEEEMKEHGVKVEILPLTQKESALEIIKRGLKDQLESTIAIIKDIKSELDFNNNVLAYYDYANHKLRVLIDVIQKRESNKEQYSWSLLKTVYHEYQHAIINEANTGEIKSLEDFYLNLEAMIEGNDYFYLIHHDDFFEEILANKYGVEKASNLLEKKFSHSDTYKKLKPTIILEKIYQEIYYHNHNIDPFLERVNLSVKNYGDLTDIIDLYNSDPRYSIISILYNKDGSFKNLQELVQNTGWQKLPEDVKYIIISSEPYLKELDYKNASEEELYTILNALNYSDFIGQSKTNTNNSIRNKLNELSKKLIATDGYNLKTYVDTVLLLNKKEELNQKKLLSLRNHKKEIKDLINKKNNHPKVKKLK